MATYDPLTPPNPKTWLELGESERAAAVAGYHRRERIPLPNLQLHAMLHVIIENQAALGDETPVRRTLARRMKEGVDRHEAIHAVASVMNDFLFSLLKGEASAGDPNAAYFAKLEEPTIASWRRDFG